MTGRNSQFEVTFTGTLRSPRVVVAPVRRSRTKLIAGLLGLTMAVGPGLWAGWRYSQVREHNTGARPVAAREQVSVTPGDALVEQAGELVPAATPSSDGLLDIDLGQISAGQSQSYEDLFRIRNDGETPVVVMVDPAGISQAPLHAAVSGEEAPGTFRIEPGEEQPVDLSLTSDIATMPTDVIGAIGVRTASGLFDVELPTAAEVTAPSADSLLATLLAAAENPGAGLGLIGDPAAGLTHPDFTVEGVWDGGIYGADVGIRWEPIGPLTRVRGTLNGRSIDREETVSEENDYVLKLEGYVLDSAPFSKELGFRIDRTPPASAVVSPPIVASDDTTFEIKAEDHSPVTAVDLVLIPQEITGPPAPAVVYPPEIVRQVLESPEATPSPEATEDEQDDSEQSETDTSPEPTPDETSSAESDAEASPTPEETSSAESDAEASPTPEPTPDATPTPTPVEPVLSQIVRPGEPITAQATYDAERDLWLVRTSLPAGTYVIYTEARDVADNQSNSARQVVQVVPAP
jgi:hypothetical protein